METRALFYCCLIIYFLLGTLEISTADELFTVPPKKGKQSVNTLKKNNIEVCAQALRISASLVQEVGNLQEQLLVSIDHLLEHDDRAFHQEQEPKLRKALEHAQRIQNLLAQSRQSLVG